MPRERHPHHVYPVEAILPHVQDDPSHKAGMPLMFKVKPNARLKEHCKGDEALFNLLGCP